MFKLNKKIILSTFALAALLSSSLSFAGGNIFDAIKKRNIKEVKRLVEKEKIDVNKADDYGETPLSCACWRNSLDMVKCLVENGAKKSINKEDYNCVTPLFWACQNNNLKMVKYLIQKGAKKSINKVVSCRYHKGENPFYWACKNNNLEMVKYLIQKGANDPLLKACKVGNFKVVSYLVENSAKESINKSGNNGETPLYWACWRNSLDMVKYLVQNGAKESINKMDNDGYATLYWACFNNNLDMVKYLIENGAQIDTKSVGVADCKIKTYILNAKKFDNKKNMLGKTKFVADKVKKIKLDNNDQKQEIIDLVRLAFCRSIFETIEKQELYTKTVFYKLYQSKKDKKIIAALKQAFVIGESGVLPFLSGLLIDFLAPF
ncbi:ankyrin repeat domain-containing protein, partial [Candidatus Dependentiae bacterium]